MLLALQKTTVRAIFFIMKNKRFQYFINVLIVIASGIISRKISIVPLIIGDILYAVMIFFIIKMLFLNLQSIQVAIFSLTFCYLIECLQLYQSDWIIEIRKTFFGRYLLGQGFLWSDLLAYFSGTIMAILLDTNMDSKKYS